MSTPQDYVPYLNQAGMAVYSDTPPASGDNDVLFCCYYLLACPPDRDEKRRIRAAIFDHYTRPDGFTKKNIRDDDIQSVDNVIASCYMAVVLDWPEHAKGIIDAWRKTGGVWPHGEDLGRFVVLEPLLQLACLEKPGVLGKLLLSLALMESLFHKEPDSFSLSRLMVGIIQKVCPSTSLVRATASIWTLVMKLRGRTMRSNLINYGWDAHSAFVRNMNI